MLLRGVCLALVLTAGMLTLPDTPRSLIRRGHSEHAYTVLLSLRGDPLLARRELTDILDLERQQHDTPTRLSTPWVRRLLLLGYLLVISQQITGIGTIVYAPTVLASFGCLRLGHCCLGLSMGAQHSHHRGDRSSEDH
jgi:hypothetical protein